MLTLRPEHRAVTREILADLPHDRQVEFETRWARWWPDVDAGLTALYSPETSARFGPILLRKAALAYRERDPELRRLDLERLLQPDWLLDPAMVGYAAYTERFAGDLAGVADRIPYLKDMGVSYLHLMPLLAPRAGDNDGGYAVADYRSVRADLGTVDDLRALTARLRGEGISLVLDLVLNHVAAEHTWAEQAQKGDPHYRDYFYVFADRTLPDAYERTLPEIFPDFAPGSFTWDEQLNGWVWTTFNSWQWDVNWSNPDVLSEYADIIFFLANAGVEVLRLDAIAFMWKRMGTDCQGQPEVHQITQVLRALARIVAPALAFKAEAIVAPSKLVQYLGTGQFTGKVSDLAYHNSLMVQIWSMLATSEVTLATQALRTLPPTPQGAGWITYVRCHDDIGWAISDEDAAAVGLGGFEHRAFLSQWFSGLFPGSPARGLTFQYNPATQDRRISGTAASLLGIESALSTGDEQALDRGLAALRLAHAIALGWGGIPVIWSGDELATCNDPQWALEPGHESDNRWAHRPRLDEKGVADRHTRTTVAGRAFSNLRALIEVRRRTPQLHGGTYTYLGDVDDPGVLVTSRPHPLGTMLGLYNVTPQWRPWPGYRLQQYGIQAGHELIADQSVDPASDGNYWLAPYAAWWIVDRAAQEPRREVNPSGN